LNSAEFGLSHGRFSLLDKRKETWNFPSLSSSIAVAAAMTTMITAAAAMAMLVSVATPPVGEGEIGAEINLYLELECL
jgi:hypothetical protein